MRSSKAADRVPQDQAATARFLSAGSRGRLLAALLFCESGAAESGATFRLIARFDTASCCGARASLDRDLRRSCVRVRTASSVRPVQER